MEADAPNDECRIENHEFPDPERQIENHQF